MKKIRKKKKLKRRLIREFYEDPYKIPSIYLAGLGENGKI